jgi:hypothetical protein
MGIIQYIGLKLFSALFDIICSTCREQVSPITQVIELASRGLDERYARLY